MNPTRSRPSDDKLRYRRVSTQMWADDKFVTLSRPGPNGQSLWQFLICGPLTLNVPGLLVAGELSIAERLHWSLPGFRKAWKELEDREMVVADWDALVVWLPKAIKHNPPESPNVIRAWRGTLREIPGCALKRRAIGELHAYCEGFGEGFRRAFDEVLPEGYAKGFVHA